MHTSFLKKQYAIQVAKGDRTTDALNQTSPVQAIIDPRFDALINRATRSNQISPELNIQNSSPNTNSTARLDPTTLK
jgi:hypothetical protein